MKGLGEAFVIVFFAALMSPLVLVPVVLAWAILVNWLGSFL